ncbi:peroxisomal membrane protein pmp47b [Nannochloropsis gaditana CCMP526]|uniref:peroxisomal membrane protein pmp47b n=1 Tax=Nannochloropsis gaditana (strain CCMP526) TaxID=1093141 RepID=UPI00029F62B8|nr:peroxisomal membrane protein pmp47b [Nannochloropsis gaditana CCMP526]EKU22349.1 peroxisomal membrane protein pmp47b [Nannochloropsis gaditana CCMP526]|eukprot:XP_005854012.1 peroxisomal membrane protein pmp47b [Nannochloropsis gaditana CCMP526]
MLMAQGKGVREGEEGGREGGKEATVLFTLQKTLRDEGVPGLYRGMAPELTRGVLSAALMLMIKERLYDFNKRMLLKTMRT